ncbi:MAG: hypothetical protein QM733_19415 [Ilumatobacteraceae bacterium]
MAWDSSRPVPWNRLLKEAAIFLVVGGVIFAVFIKDTKPSSYVGLVIGMGIYVGFSVVLAKFGYTRETMKQARARQAAARQQQGRSRGAAASPMSRPKPAPTKRTSTGPSNRPKSKKR